MKSFSISLEEIGSWPALWRAWQIYRSGKRMRPSVATFELDAGTRLLALSRDLLSGAYTPSPYRVMNIKDPKPRLIAIAPVQDRIVHTTIYQSLGPTFERGLTEDCYACLPERGAHRAMLRYQQGMRSFPYLIHLDIHCYYPNVDHEILLSLMKPKIRDAKVVKLLKLILASGHQLYQQPMVRSFYPTADSGRPCGLPIGNLTSQCWGNLYLNKLDHYIKRELKTPLFLRYMDDMVLFGPNRAYLRRCRKQIEIWLAKNRNLTLNPRKGHIRSTQTTQTYLGYRISPWARTPGKKMIERFRRDLPNILDEPEDSLYERLIAWRGLISW